MHDKGEYGSFEMEAGDEANRAAILTITHAEYENLRRFGAAVFLDRTLIGYLLRWTAYPIMFISETQALIS
jgi:hypothetical protein